MLYSSVSGPEAPLANRRLGPGTLSGLFLQEALACVAGPPAWEDVFGGLVKSREKTPVWMHLDGLAWGEGKRRGGGGAFLFVLDHGSRRTQKYAEVMMMALRKEGALIAYPETTGILGGKITYLGI